MSTSTDEQAPTIVRLSFWIPHERMAEFEALYERELVPVLKSHGLVESAQYTRPHRKGIFSRFFELDAPVQTDEKREALITDPIWTKILNDIGDTFDTADPSGSARFYFGLVLAPAGTCKVETAGPGESVPVERRQGNWKSFSEEIGYKSVEAILEDQEGYIWFGTETGATRYDGQSWTVYSTETELGGNGVSAIFQARDGSIWFGTADGACRYDGKTWTTFTTEDGLGYNQVRSIVEDRDGNLWFGTGHIETDGSGEGGGVTRYDGKVLKTFTVKDGLAHNVVSSICLGQDGYLWFATMNGVSRYDGTSWLTITTKDGLVDNRVWSILQDRQGNLWFGTYNGLSRLDSQTWTTFDVKDGLVDNDIRTIFQDNEGHLWFGTDDSGVIMYDGNTWTTFSTKDGLLANRVAMIIQDRDGFLWLGTSGGVNRYDGQVFLTFPRKGRIANNRLYGLFQDKKGNFWFGTNNGICRYDGKTWHSFTAEDGLPSSVVFSGCEDRDGRIWFGTADGVCRYDGKTWTTFTTKDGLPHYDVLRVLQDRHGHFWFSVKSHGVCHYDGKTWTTFTTADGLGYNQVRAIIEDNEGCVWFCTTGGGVNRYDGKTWNTFTTKDGLAHDHVDGILQDREGVFWFGTAGGVSRFDGKTWTTFNSESDGLNHQIGSIFQDKEGYIWFMVFGLGLVKYDGQVFQKFTRRDGLLNTKVSVWEDAGGHLMFQTEEGLTRYNLTQKIPPQIFIDRIIADQRYEGNVALTVLSSVGLIIFEFHAMSFKTRPEAMIYRYRLKGYDEDWSNTNEQRAEYQSLPVGTYTFEVVAVDRDLAYSEEPATIDLAVERDTRDEQIDELEQRVRKRTRELEDTHQRLQDAQAQLIQELEDELQTAHDMQMSLMPTASPKVEGFDIAGRCIPASQVGGDFFQYFDHDGKLSLALADVTGHAMAAAIPVVLFNGVLESQVQRGDPVKVLFRELNNTLHRVLDQRTFVCFTMGEIDLQTHGLHLANGGCPPPYHYKASSGEIVELQLDAYPLGISPDTGYDVLEVQLEAGDSVVFCSDGIAEAENGAGEQFGYESTEETILQACAHGLSAEATIDRILDAVNTFSGAAPQGDDMTCVVVRVEDVGKSV